MYADLRISQSSLGTGSEGMDSGAEARWPQGLKRTHYVRTGLSGDKSSLAVAGRNQNRHIAHAGPPISVATKAIYQDLGSGTPISSWNLATIDGKIYLKPRGRNSHQMRASDLHLGWVKGVK